MTEELKDKIAEFNLKLENLKNEEKELDTLYLSGSQYKKRKSQIFNKYNDLKKERQEIKRQMPEPHSNPSHKLAMISGLLALSSVKKGF